MLAIFVFLTCVLAWSYSAEVHYCYYCSTSLSGVEPLVQRQIMNQRLFYYPTDAIQSRCHGPSLSRRGSVQICSEPLCVSINAQIENVNFTILGCADTILRPSVKVPDKNEDHCIKLPMAAGVDFNVCYCSSTLCNIDGPYSGKTYTMNGKVASTETKPVTKVVERKEKIIVTSTTGTSAPTSNPAQSTSSVKTKAASQITTTQTSSTTSTTVVVSMSSQKNVELQLSTEFPHDETSGEFVDEDEHSSSEQGVKPVTTLSDANVTTNAPPHVSSKISSINTKFAETTTSQFPAYTTHKLDYDPEDQEIVELTSEEMERRANIHSEEYANYDLSSPEVEFLYTIGPKRLNSQENSVEQDPESSSKKHIVSTSSVTSTLQPTTMLTADMIQPLNNVYTNSKVESNAEKNVSIVISSTLSTSTASIAEIQTSSSVTANKSVLDSSQQLISNNETSEKLHPLSSLTTSITSHKFTKLATTTPLVLEQGISGSSYGNRASSKSTQMVPNRSRNRSNFDNFTSLSTSKPKKFDLSVKGDVTTTTSDSLKFNKSKFDKQDRQIADSPRSQLSDDLESSKKKLKSSNHLDNLPKSAESSPVLASQRTHNASGFCVILLFLLSFIL